MSFRMDDDELLEKYRTIWAKIDTALSVNDYR